MKACPLFASLRFIPRAAAACGLLFLVCCACTMAAHAQDGDSTVHSRAVFAGIDLSGNTVYVLRLRNGDVLSGVPLEFATDPEFGTGLVLRTALGDATVFAQQVAEIVPQAAAYRHGHRLFLLPTALPVGDNHFVGALELAVLYGGAGIGDVLSFTAGRSFVPTVPAGDQLSLYNAKATVLRGDTDVADGRLSLALGANLAYLNDDNSLLHAFMVATLERSRTTINAALFYKLGSEDFYVVQAGTRFDPFTLHYADGSFGVAVGLDTKFSERHDLHFIGELWNSDIANPTNTGVLLGLRLANSSFAADFGLAFFTQPAFAPFAAFMWTPF